MLTIPRSISHKIVRHRIGVAYSQQSQRYVDLSKEPLKVVAPVPDLSELTEILLSYNAEYALNIDGGGSTELIYNNKLYNFPSEGKERPINYGLGKLRRI